MSKEAKIAHRKQIEAIAKEINELVLKNPDAGVCQVRIMDKTTRQKVRIYFGKTILLAISTYAVGCLSSNFDTGAVSVILAVFSLCCLGGTVLNLVRFISVAYCYFCTEDDVNELECSKTDVDELLRCKEFIVERIRVCKATEQRKEAAQAKFRRLESVVRDELCGTLSINDHTCYINDGLTGESWGVELSEEGYMKMVRKIVKMRRLQKLVQDFEASL